VVALEATGDDDGQPYLVMEYLQGFTVRDVFFRAVTEGGLPQDHAAAILLGAARGLQAAHSALDERGHPIGLVHRDVSPHNLFLTDAGVVKVLDFGIAKGASDVTMTRAGHVKGKASYLAPEQLVAGGAVDQRADVFSLGIVAWELFTGKRLFKRASETDTINAIRSLRVPDPSSIHVGLDAAYSETVLGMLARNPADRPQLAGQVANAFEAALLRRAPVFAGPGSEAELAKYVMHVRTLSPAEEAAPPSVPVAPAPLDRAGRQKAFAEAWGGEEGGRTSAPPEEATATVAPPVRGSWAGNHPSGPKFPPALPTETVPLDGSVPGTWAIAGARRPSPDGSGGFETLDPDDIVEASKSEALPRGSLGLPPAPGIPIFDPPGPKAPTRPASATPETDAGTPAETYGLARPAVADVAGAPPPRQAPVEPAPTTVPTRRYSPGLEQFLKAHPDVDRALHARPTPAFMAGVLVAALLTGMLVAYVVASIVG
jgi:hypothetical protein